MNLNPDHQRIVALGDVFGVPRSRAIKCVRYISRCLRAGMTFTEALDSIFANESTRALVTRVDDSKGELADALIRTGWIVAVGCNAFFQIPPDEPLPSDSTGAPASGPGSLPGIPPESLFKN